MLLHEGHTTLPIPIFSAQQTYPSRLQHAVEALAGPKNDSHASATPMMNWTESSLNRFSRPKGWSKDQARQKKSFARARPHAHPATLARSTSQTTVPFVPSHVPQRAPKPQSNLDLSKGILSNPSSSSHDHVAQLLGRVSTESVESSPQAPIDGCYDTLSRRSTSKKEVKAELEAKRRKLLGQTDWTGIEVQKPLVVDYDGSNRELRDKHHKPLKNSHAPCDAQNAVATGGRSPGISPYEQGQPSRRHELLMRLRVGSESMQWSQDNNTFRAASRRISPFTNDEDERTRDAWDSSRQLTLSPQPRISSVQEDWSEPWDRRSPMYRVSPRQELASKLHYRGPAARDKEFHQGDSFPLAIHHPHPSRDQINTVRIPPILSLTTQAAGNMSQAVAAGSPFEAASSLASSASFLFTRPDGPNPVQPGHTVRASSTCHEERFEKPRSIITEIGGQRKEQRAIRREEDNEWTGWIEPSCERLERGIARDHQQAARSITPGFSQALNASDTPDTTLRRPSLILRALDGSPHDEAQNSALVSGEDDTHHLEETSMVHLAVSTAMSKEGENGEAQPDPVPSARGGERVNLSHPHMAGVRDSIGLAPHGHGLHKPPHVQDLPTKVERIGQGKGDGASKDLGARHESIEDEDEIWIKFVCDGDTAEISRQALAHAREVTTLELLKMEGRAKSDIAGAPGSSIQGVRSPVHDHTTSQKRVRKASGNLPEGPQNEAPPSISAKSIGSATSSVFPTMTSATSLAAEPGSSDHGSRFHQPPPFIGRRAYDVPPPQPPRVPNKRRPHRSLRRREFRRLNIRTMPSFEGDPIESDENGNEHIAEG